MTGPFRDDKIHVVADMCSTCVMRPGNLMDLVPGRLKVMVDAAQLEDRPFSCHSTTHRKDGVLPALCRGYLDTYGSPTVALAKAMDMLVEVPPEELPGVAALAEDYEVPEVLSKVVGETSR